MQCHVDACDDMQPPELVSVYPCFLKTALWNELSDKTKLIRDLEYSPWQLAPIKIYKAILLAPNLVTDLMVYPLTADNVTRNVELCSSLVKIEELFCASFTHFLNFDKW